MTNPPSSDRDGDNEGLPPGYVPAWTFIKTPEGVVEYEHEGALALRMETIPASDLRPGDGLVLPGYDEPVPVTHIQTLLLANSIGNRSVMNWPVLHIQTGVMGFVRLPHEPVRVVRGG